jgi:hypothetical protein
VISTPRGDEGELKLAASISKIMENRYNFWREASKSFEDDDTHSPEFIYSTALDYNITELRRRIHPFNNYAELGVNERIPQ